MRVKSKKKHFNSFGDTYEKKPPKVYEAPDAIAANLIAAGLVESAEKKSGKKKADEA